VAAEDGATRMTAPGAIPERALPEKSLFGHPRGLTVLFTTEMWERFSYYGMRALLVLYLVHDVLLPGRVEHVLFYAQVKAFYEALFGPLSVQQLSSWIYGTYTGFIYASPLLGGWIGDNYLGQRKTAVIGIIGMTIGEFMLMSPALLFPALLILIVAGGLFKTNTAAQVGMLYRRGDSRRDRAYSIYYIGVNIGAALAPLVAGTLGELIGWKYGFGAAGVGLILALISYFAGWKYLPADGAKTKATRAARQPLNSKERKSVLSLLMIVIPLVFWWACYEQQGNVIALFADANTDRRLIPGLINWEIPVTWFQSFNPIMIFLFTPFLLALWTRQARASKEPNSMYKMVAGAVMLGVSYLVLAFAAWHGAHGRVSWLWLGLYFAIITTGEIFLSPISQSLFSKVAPARIASLAMAVVFLPNFLGGGLLQGYIGTYWSTMSHPLFFLAVAAIGFAAAAMLLALEKPLAPYLKMSDDLSP
jgi:POT family proton-dependent oligopeptide transporter